MTTNLNIVYYKGLLLTDVVLSLGVNAAFAPTAVAGIAVSDVPGVAPGFFIGYDEFGEGVLCTVKTIEGLYPLVSNTGTYYPESAPGTVVGCILIGGHPVHRPA